ncbi:TPM domain-containing protein [uncultured Croceicoccus sp.]|uniref:TPM domain-containing protein n=1 Tax=uncultured Croceicoccus sp. TaxID=1295329 RepID=UPI002639DDAC|nr:TPM domain-containing protein [uncultured Croceicoccus sp.]
MVSAILTPANHDAISAAVSRAEARTSGEIVTVLADRSDGYSDIALAWAALFGFGLIVLAGLFPAPLLALLDMVQGGWDTQYAPGPVLEAGAALGIVGFLGLWLALGFDRLRFATVPGRVRTQRVHERAISIFRVGAERRTHGRTGVLIYLSMQEHRAEILADEAIAAKVSDDIWGEAMAAMLIHLKRGDTTAGMVAAIERVGAVLTEHLPADHTNPNEIPDRLIEI